MGQADSDGGSCIRPARHVDVGLGKLTHIVAKARLSAALLWEHEIGTALTVLYGFLAEFLLVPFTLQVSEVHLCVDIADWEVSINDMSAFITRSRSKGLRLGSDAADAELGAAASNGVGWPHATAGNLRDSGALCGGRLPPESPQTASHYRALGAGCLQLTARLTVCGALTGARVSAARSSQRRRRGTGAQAPPDSARWWPAGAAGRAHGWW